MIDFFKLKYNKNIFLISAGNFLRILLVIAYSRLMTYFLDYEELSKYYIVFSIYTFFSFIIIGSIGTYVNRKVIEWVNENTMKDALFELFKKILLPLTLIAFISVFIYTLFIYRSFEYSLLICILVSALIIFKTSSEAIYPMFNLLNFNNRYILFLILFNLLNLILSSLFVYFFDVSFQYWMLGLISSNFLIAIMSWKSLDKELKFNNTAKVNYKELYTFSSNILVGHVLIWFLTDGFRFIAEYKFTADKLGILLLGLVVPTQIFAVIENILGQLLYPHYLENISNKNYKERSKAFNNYINKTIPIILFVAIFISISSYEVLSVLVDSSKINNDLILIFKIGLWIEFFRITINTLKYITTSEYKTSRIIIPYLLGAAIFCLGVVFFNLNLFLFAILLLISYTFITVFSFVSFNRIIKIKFNIQILIKISLYILPAIIFLIYFKNIFTLLICWTYLSLILYQLINNDIN